MNQKQINLLKRVRDKHILGDPSKVNMRPLLESAKDYKQRSVCGAVGCIAGWTVVEASRKNLTVKDGEVYLGKDAVSEEFLWRDATRLLGISSAESHELFTPLMGDIEARPGTKKYAKAVANRINNFIVEQGGQP